MNEHLNYSLPEKRPTRELDNFTARAVDCGLISAADADPEAFASPEFKAFVESLGFKLEDLDSNQRRSLLQHFDEKSAAATTAAEPQGLPSGFEDYVRSMGFAPAALTKEQGDSLLDLYESREDEARG